MNTDRDKEDLGQMDFGQTESQSEKTATRKTKNTKNFSSETFEHNGKTCNKPSGMAATLLGMVDNRFFNEADLSSVFEALDKGNMAPMIKLLPDIVQCEIVFTASSEQIRRWVENPEELKETATQQLEQFTYSHEKFWEKAQMVFNVMEEWNLAQVKAERQKTPSTKGKGKKAGKTVKKSR